MHVPAPSKGSWSQAGSSTITIAGIGPGLVLPKPYEPVQGSVSNDRHHLKQGSGRPLAHEELTAQ